MEQIELEVNDYIYNNRGNLTKYERIELVPPFSPFVQSWFCNNCNYRTKQYLRTALDSIKAIKCNYCGNENVRIAH